MHMSWVVRPTRPHRSEGTPSATARPASRKDPKGVEAGAHKLARVAADEHAGAAPSETVPASGVRPGERVADVDMVSGEAAVVEPHGPVAARGKKADGLRDRGIPRPGRAAAE